MNNRQITLLLEESFRENNWENMKVSYKNMTAASEEVVATAPAVVGINRVSPSNYNTKTAIIHFLHCWCTVQPLFSPSEQWKLALAFRLLSKHVFPPASIMTATEISILVRKSRIPLSKIPLCASTIIHQATNGVSQQPREDDKLRASKPLAC